MKRAPAQLLKAILPLRAHDSLREVRRLGRRMGYRVRRLTGKAATVTALDIADGLRSLGVKEGDAVIVHSSLRSLGHVDGGAETVVQALLSVLGPEGTLVVPTLTFGGDMYSHFETYDDAKPFDARTTPSRMGKVTEIVRTMPGARRSVHPSHSVAAVGPEADYLTRDHHLDSHGFGTSSPYYRLCEIRGKILMLGVDLTTMTAFHVIEDLVESFPMAVYVPKIYSVGVILPDGQRHQMKCLVHNPEMTAIRDCNKIEPYFDEYGILRKTRIGDAKVMLIDGARLNPTMQALLDRGVTIYTPRT